MRHLICIFILWSSSAFAGGGGVDIAGGGHGLERNGKLVLLDLAEAGIEEPYFISRAPDFLIEERLLEATGHRLLPLSLLGAKIQQIGLIDPVLAESLIVALQTMSWRLAEGPFVLTEDSSTFLAGTPVQLAVRQSGFVVLQKSNWEKLSDEQKTALVIHEALASLQAEPGLPTQVRRLTALLFSKDFFSGSRTLIRESLVGFPSEFSGIEKLRQMRMGFDLIRGFSTRFALHENFGRPILNLASPQVGGVFLLYPFVRVRREVESFGWANPLPQQKLSTLFYDTAILDFEKTRNLCFEKKPVWISYGYFTVTENFSPLQGGKLTPRLQWNLSEVLYNSHEIRDSQECLIFIERMDSWLKKSLPMTRL